LGRWRRLVAQRIERVVALRNDGLELEDFLGPRSPLGLRADSQLFDAGAQFLALRLQLLNLVGMILIGLRRALLEHLTQALELLLLPFSSRGKNGRGLARNLDRRWRGPRRNVDRRRRLSLQRIGRPFGARFLDDLEQVLVERNLFLARRAQVD